MSLELRAESIADTHAVAAALAELVRVGDTIVLAGEMGSGKTAFAQGFGRALGIDEPITSPTFTLVHSYDVQQGPWAGKLTLHHADLYRLERTSEVADLALGELAEFRGVVLVEWGDVVEGVFGDHLVVRLEPDAEDDVAPGGPGGVRGGLGSAEVDVAAQLEAHLDAPRRIEIAGVGRTWAGRWDRVCDAVERFRC